MAKIDQAPLKSHIARSLGHPNIFLFGRCTHSGVIFFLGFVHTQAKPKTFHLKMRVPINMYVKPNEREP